MVKRAPKVSKDRFRAFDLRRRLKAGEQLTDMDRAWLAAYEASSPRAAPPPATPLVDFTPEQRAPIDEQHQPVEVKTTAADADLAAAPMGPVEGAPAVPEPAALPVTPTATPAADGQPPQPGAPAAAGPGISRDTLRRAYAGFIDANDRKAAELGSAIQVGPVLRDVLADAFVDLAGPIIEDKLKGKVPAVAVVGVPIAQRAWLTNLEKKQQPKRERVAPAQQVPASSPPPRAPEPSPASATPDEDDGGDAGGGETLADMMAAG